MKTEPNKTLNIAASPQLLSQLVYSMMLAMSGWYRTVKRYVWCLRRVARLDLASISLAFIFSSAVGAMSQDVTGPVGVFEMPPTCHNGTTPFNMAIVFDEEPKNVGRHLVGLLVRGSTDGSTGKQRDKDYSNSEHAPLISDGEKDPNNPLRYTFIVTPRAPIGLRVRLSGGYTDSSGNQGASISSTAIRGALPVANAGLDQTVASGTLVTLDGSGLTDCDGTITSYGWARTDGTTLNVAPNLSSTTVARPTFTADILEPGDADVTHVFTLTVTDNASVRDTDTVEIRVTAPNEAPVANAGDDQTVASGAIVTLDGSGSTDDGTTRTFRWFHGDTQPLTNVRGVGSIVAFRAPVVAPGAANLTLVFTLVVTDNDGVQHTDTVEITVTAPDGVPVADAGDDQTVASGATVTLDGRGSTVSDGTINYAWTRTGGTGDNTVAPSSTTAQQPTFTADTLMPGAEDVTHEFTLIVTDDDNAISVADTVTITVTAPFRIPIAEAGPDQVMVVPGATVTLDGSGSTVDRRRLIRSWAWTRTGGTGGTITLNDASAEQPTFTADALTPGADDVTHVFDLTMTDNAGKTSTDTVMITVISGVADPVANAGPDSEVGSATMVTLDGSGSTVDRRRTITSYGWTRTGGTGGSVTLSSATAAAPTFTADTLADGAEDVTHVFELTLTDSAGDTDTDTVTITVTAGNVTPVADAGDDRTVASGDEVTLDGSGSTDDGTITYAWTRTGGTGRGPDDTPPFTLTGEDTAMPGFTADTLQEGVADVTHVFELVVTDDDDVTATDTVTITVTAPKTGPVANAGVDQRVGSGMEVTLDGRRSIGRDGKITSHAWARTGGTTGGSVTLSSTKAVRPTFTADTLADGAGDITHVFTLTITNDDGLVATDTVTITVTAGDLTPPTGRFESPPTHDGKTAFTVTLVFDEEVEFDFENLVALLTGVTGTGIPTVVGDSQTNVLGFDYNNDDHRPAISNFRKDPNDALRYTFTVTPAPRAAVDEVPVAIGIRLGGRHYKDLNGNQGASSIRTTIPWMDPDTDAPVASAGNDQTVASGATVTLDGSASRDDDGMITSYAWTRTSGTGGPVVLSDATAAEPTFTADNLAHGAADVTHVFSLIVTDNGNAMSTDTVIVTVTAPFLRPIANAGADQMVGFGATVALDGSGSTVDRRRTPLAWAWVRTGGSGGAVTLSDASAEQPSFTTDALLPDADGLLPDTDDVTHEFTLTVTDSEGGISTDTVTITVTPPPDAYAGTDQVVDSGSEVRLRGDLSTDDDGTIASYAWTRTGGSGGTVNLRNASTAQPAFTADNLAAGAADVTHVFTLTVTNDDGVTGTDTVMITVTAPFAAPVAKAGPDQVVPSGTAVTLDGSGSTADRRRTIASHAWERIGGTEDAEVTLSSATAEQPNFTTNATNPLPDAVIVTHIFKLTVTDSAGKTSFDTVSVSIVIPGEDEDTGTVPVANAGADRTVTSGMPVTLDGSGSTVNHGRTIKSYAWRWIRWLSIPAANQPDDAVVPVTLTGGTTAMPTFTAPDVADGKEDEIHVFELTVTDSAGHTDTDRVSITVIYPFKDPVANAGPDRKVGSGTVVTLDGSGSTVDLRNPDPSKSYGWARTGGTSTGTVILTDADTAMPGFTAETLTSGAADVTHIFTLTVTDSDGEDDTDTVTITVTLGNADPTANAGEDQPAVVSGATVTLDGSASRDSAGMAVASYAWARTGGTGDAASVTLTGEDTAMPTFRAEILQAGTADVTHVFTLTVTDGDSETATDTVTITVIPANVVPVANAGVDRKVGSGVTVTLDGSRSYDIGGTIASHAWARTGGTTGGSVTLTGADTARQSFTADTLAAGASDVIHIFTLTVTDDNGATATDTVTITVTAADTVPPTGRFEPPLKHDGETAFTVELVFDEEAATLDAGNIAVLVNNLVRSDEGNDYDEGLLPVISDFRRDPNNKLRHTFTVTPNHTHPWISFLLRGRDYQDVAGNVGVADIRSVPVLYVNEDIDNAAPVVMAGDDQTVQSNESVMLAGSATDLSGSIMSYAWARTGGTTGGFVALTGENTATARFTADTLAGGADDVTHEFTLTVIDVSHQSFDGETVPDVCRDGRISEERCTEAYRNSVDDAVTITVNAPPLADAGDDQMVDSAAPVTLDGSGSEDSNTGLTHAWERTGGTQGATAPTLTNADMAMASFTADTLADGAEDVTHIYTLTVTDNNGAEATDTVTVTVRSGFVAPMAIANTTTPRIGSEGTVTLDGSGSTHDDRTGLTYAWARTGGTGTATGTLTNADMAMATFTAEARSTGDPDVTHILTLTVTDTGGGTDTATVTITVTAGFTDPVAIIAGAAEREVASGGTVPLDGSGSTHDDRTSLTYAWTLADGNTTGLMLPATATPVFTPPTLTPGDPDATHILTLTVTDSEGESDTAMVTITVISGFADPVAMIAGGNRSVAPGVMVDLDGSGSTVDRRRTIRSYAWTRADGTTTGLTTPAMATAGFTPPPLTSGDTDATHILTLTVTDSGGESDTATVTITVTAGFTDPVAIIAGAAEREIASGGTVPLDGGGSTFDSRRTPLTYAWARTGGTSTDTGTLTNANMAMASFRAEARSAGDPDVTHILTLTVTDGASAMATATVTITVISGFADPVAMIAGGNRSVAPGGMVDLDGGGSTVDRRRTIRSYAWTRADGTTTGLTTPAMATATFTPPPLTSGDPDATHVLTLTVTDSGGESDTATVTITVTAGFTDPVAIIAGAAEREVASGGTVSLDGSGSTFDSRRTPLAYAWTRTGGTSTDTGTLTNANMAMATFTAEARSAGDPDVTHILTLTVTDSESESDAAMVTITVVSDFADPVAMIAGGNRSVAPGGMVDLDGSGSTVDRRRTIRSYAWTRADGTTTGLTTPAMATATFTPPPLTSGDPDVTHILTLTVTDTGGGTDTATVTITVTAGFTDPVAIIAGAAEREIASGGTVPLDGGGSTFDSRRTPLAYAWTRADGTTMGLTTPDMATAIFTPPPLTPGDPDATHILTLTVTDSEGESDAAMVTITVVSDFADPVAMIAGGDDREVYSREPVILDGSGSTVDRRRTISSYAWTRTGGTGNSGVLTGERTDTAMLTFTADTVDTAARGGTAVTHVFSLLVTDSEGESDTATVTITVMPNEVPLANAGPNQTIASGEGEEITITLNGSDSSDTGGTIMTWAWTRTGGTGSAVTLSDATAEQPTFDAPTLTAGAENVTYEFTLIVTDNEGVESLPVTVTVTIIAPSAEPVANAGPDQNNVASGAPVTLDGTASSKDRRRNLTYVWERTSGTMGATVALTNADMAMASFTADTLDPGEADVIHVFTLTVTDEDGSISIDRVTVTVRAVVVNIDVRPPNVTVQEGGSGAYQVKLSQSPPQGASVIFMAFSDNEDVVPENGRLVFNADNWNTWQDVTIRTVADSDKDNDNARIQHRLVQGEVALGQQPGIVTVTVREVDPVLRPVGEFLATRATALLNIQPDLTGFLRQDGTTGSSGNFSFRATNGRLAMNGGFVHSGVWGQVTGSYASGESGDVKSILGSFGIHRKYSERFLAGAMLQFDLAEQDMAGNAGAIDGTGWLAGPYFAARHDSQPLYFEGRLLYGQSDNDIRFIDPALGVRTGSFDSKRLLAQLRVEGEIALSAQEAGPRLIPYADARWIEDRAAAFTDSKANRVPGQKISVGQFELGSKVDIPIAVRSGEMTLTGGLGLVWSNTQGDYITSDSRSRGRGEIGFSYDLDDNLRIDLDSFYDGIGTSGYEGYGLSLSAEMKF